MSSQPCKVYREITINNSLSTKLYRNIDETTITKIRNTLQRRLIGAGLKENKVRYEEEGNGENKTHSRQREQHGKGMHKWMNREVMETQWQSRASKHRGTRRKCNKMKLDE